MLGEQELNDFFAHIDEISQDSNSLDQFQLLQKYRSENARLTQTLSKIRESTKSLLDILKEERQVKTRTQKQLDHANLELKSLQVRCSDLERSNVNNEFSYKEKIDELELKQQQLTESQKELAKDYFDVLEEATMFHNFEIKKERNRIVNKTSVFLKEMLGKKFKRPHLVMKKIAPSSEAKSTTVSKRSRCSKKDAPLVELIKKSKRRKVDIFEMQSISEASSPASFYDEGADMGEDNEENDSAFTYNTFSIGNESSFTLLQSKKVAACTQTVSRCKCYIDPEETELVSVGVNTESIDPLPSVPSLADDDFVFDHDEVVNSTVNCSAIDDDNFDIEPTESAAAAAPEEERVMVEKSPLKEIAPNDHLEMPMLSTPPRKETRDQSTTCAPQEMISKVDKSTLTTRSLTHRGTMTPAVVSKNFGMQFPDITFDRIIEEMQFDVPDCLSPIKDIEKVTRETQTDIQNVNRELSASEVAPKISSEEQSFIVLGQTIFNLFLNRLKENNKAVDDDARTREKLWKFLRQQYLDRFDELTFDEYFSTSFVSDSDSHENVCSKAIEDIKGVKDIKISLEAQLEMSDSSSQKSSTATEHSVDILEDLAVSSSASSDKECEEQTFAMPLPLSPIHEVPEIDAVDDYIKEMEEILKNIDALTAEPLKNISPILEFEDFMWSTIFPPTIDKNSKISEHESPRDDKQVLEGYDIDHDPVEIPTECLESPDEPPPIAITPHSTYEPQIIPLESAVRRNLDASKDVVAYNQRTRLKLVSWQQTHQISTKDNEKTLCKLRKIIKTYLEAEWTSENLEACVYEMTERKTCIVLEAIYETVEDNMWDREISSEFTPPAPPLPRYQQRLILLISKLVEHYPKLPHLLVKDLEMKLFRLDAPATCSLDHLRNMSYYYTALVDLFFESDSTMAFYFIVKCMYFYGIKAIPMAFVVIKAFPPALPKKSLLIKKYKPDLDWENMTGLELSKIRVDLDWVNSLDLCVMYLLTNIQMYRKKGAEFKPIYEHELFSYVPKYYGFPLNCLSAQKLIELFVKRIEDGELTNMSLALILFAKRMNIDFTVKTLMRGHLMPLLNKYLAESIDSEVIEQTRVDKICLLIEAISSILKPLAEEEQSFKEIFSQIVTVLGRTSNQQIQECCIKAILRLQRFIQNHKEIYEIVKQRQEKGESFSETLSYSISTFIHRKKKAYFGN